MKVVGLEAKAKERADFSSTYLLIVDFVDELGSHAHIDFEVICVSRDQFRVAHDIPGKQTQVHIPKSFVVR